MLLIGENKVFFLDKKKKKIIEDSMVCLLESGKITDYCLVCWSLSELGLKDMLIGKDLEFSGFKQNEILNRYFRNEHYIEFVILAAALKALNPAFIIDDWANKKAIISGWHVNTLNRMKSAGGVYEFFYYIALLVSLESLGFNPQRLVFNKVKNNFDCFREESEQSDYPHFVIMMAFFRILIRKGMIVFA